MTKITPKLEKKIKALAAAQAIIEANKLTSRERKAVSEVLESYYGCGDWQDHFDGDDYMDMMKSGYKGWVDSSDAELAAEIDGCDIIQNLKDREDGD